MRRAGCPYDADVRDRLQSAKVGIIGLGGIGSHVATGLVRAGVRGFVIADFDTVSESNLFRQCYSMDQVGMPKSEAVMDSMSSIDPDLHIVSMDARIVPEDLKRLFAGCDVVIEAVDDPVTKADLVEGMMSVTGFPPVVSCSGMAGLGDSGDIAVRRPMRNLYVVGDGVSEADGEGGLFEGRVMVCAGHMVHIAVRLILGLETSKS